MDSETDASLTLKALVSSKEAGVIIGREGAAVASVRDECQVRIAVSSVVQGISERILSVSGPLSAVAKAYALIAQNIINGSLPTEDETPVETAMVRLLIPHALCGSLIGKQGCNIQELQTKSAAKVVVGRDCLQDSTERVVEVQGVVDAVHLAVYHIGKLIVDDFERISVSHRAYEPKRGYPITYNASINRPFKISNSERPRMRSTDESPSDENTEVETLTITYDMVGCIIGRGGDSINNIRRVSGARLHIADQVGESTDRIVTIKGSKEANVKALEMLHLQLESEKERRLTKEAEDENGDEVAR